MDGGTTESTGDGRRGIVEGLGSLEGWWNASEIALWSFVLFGAFLLNATLLLAFLKRPGLRSISNRFVMNLTVSNLLTCAILNPLLMLDGPSSSGRSGTTCSVAEGATALVTSSSIFSVLLIAVDQYLAVVDPLRYRTRIDKLKCGILVISVWLVSLIFAILAGFNPSPQSIWLVCGDRGSGPRINYDGNETSLNVTIDENFRFVVNATDNYSLEGELTFTEIDENPPLDIDNNTGIVGEKLNDYMLSSFEDVSSNSTGFEPANLGVTYGLVYTVAYTILAYLVPFIGVCWIYVSIYSAAHKNSERTRRTGSRPILSSASFSEEYYPVRQDVSSEDFRRIPKISSLSSIDESNESHSPSQTIMPVRGSEYLSNNDKPSQINANNVTTIEEEEPVAVVFTVGSSKVDVTSQQQQRQQRLAAIDSDKKRNNDQHELTKDTISDNKVPIAILKAQFLDNKLDRSSQKDDLIRSKFRDEHPQQKRKSSHDLMYEEMLRCNLAKLGLRDESRAIDSSEDEEENSDNDVEDENDGLNDDTSKIPMANLQTVAESHVSEKKPVDCHTRASKNEEESPGDNEESLNARLDSSSRKSSLDLSIGNIHPQSSILKAQNSYGNGKSNFRFHGAPNYPRNEQSIVNYEDNYFSKSATANNLESQIFGGAATNPPIVTITPPHKTSLHRVSSVRSTTSYINSLKHRISNGSLFKYREETRAARVSALVIVMGLICWTPYVVVLILKNLTSITGKRVSNHEAEVAAICFIIIATYVSPLLFGYRSRRVKRELRKFFCFRRELSYKNNRSLMAKKVLKRRHSGNLSQLEMDARYNIFNCVYGRTRWPKDKVHFVQVPETALVVETCRSSFSSGASTQISSTSTEEC
ncbi:uncharacterized protein [Venturia canescens]|uniref:uncharacterized protein isoform X2 n=1 Tax=Venturia canescens TaxID=32260 RepID=UPI001C9C22AC|nr:uncharacterized protein LOC122406782 isoform X2 [Venturia canescens]